MVGILIATGQNPAFHGLDEHYPISLLPLADRPFLQHVTEYIVHQGIRRIDFVLEHLPEKIEAALGDGARWGCKFRYHFVHSDEDVLRSACTLAANAGELVLVGSAQCLPQFDLSSLQPDTLLFYQDAWTGWGFFSPGGRVVEALAAMADVASVRGECTSQEVPKLLSFRTPRDFLTSQAVVLEGGFAGLLISGREADPGIRISRNVVLHPAAQVTAPVFIGENCRIGAGARIGPLAVIGHNCIIDAHSIVVNATVISGSYVGEGLELDSVIVDRNRMVNVRLGASVLISETFLLGNLTRRFRSRTLQRLCDRSIAFVLLLLLWPLLLLTYAFLALTNRGKLATREGIDLPADDHPASWRPIRVLTFETKLKPGALAVFFYRFLPGLVSVFSGHVFLVGVQPRSAPALSKLPADWRAVYLKSKVGLITEADVVFGPDASEDETYSSEVFYSATESAGHDLKLVALWCRNLFGRPMTITGGFAGDIEN